MNCSTPPRRRPLIRPRSVATIGASGPTGAVSCGEPLIRQSVPIGRLPPPLHRPARRNGADNAWPGRVPGTDREGMAVMLDSNPSTARSILDRAGPVGVWSFDLDQLPVAEAASFARDVERLGFGSLWIAEGVASREALTHAATLLHATERLVVGTGIASIWARDAISMASARRTLADAHPDRFVLGLGVSHVGAVTRRGHEYAARPVATMREYLTAMDDAILKSPEPTRPAPRLLAALRPRMLALAGERADGAHTYFVPVEHTRRARELLGADPLVVVEQAVALTDRKSTRLNSSHANNSYAVF